MAAAFLQNRSQQTVVWTKINHKLSAASSDAHGYIGLGKTYTRIGAVPTRETILKLLDTGVPITSRPGLRALFSPEYNRLRKRIRKA